MCKYWCRLLYFIYVNTGADLYLQAVTNLNYASNFFIYILSGEKFRVELRRMFSNDSGSSFGAGSTRTREEIIMNSYWTFSIQSVRHFSFFLISWLLRGQYLGPTFLSNQDKITSSELSVSFPAGSTSASCALPNGVSAQPHRRPRSLVFLINSFDDIPPYHRFRTSYTISLGLSLPVLPANFSSRHDTFQCFSHHYIRN